ncbi:MAG: prepilin-type N-terminal cleavage/methylation domain-containing protein [Gemmatales bacterium]|nr:prepilin-type N-terminal cleavage/methylation domain-containing protein [Gemmatales bacterium]MDW7995786.1 prepilin-type N-terminal cleavage/methylation domain-containing protein [Gemmatales bacterium]
MRRGYTLVEALIAIFVLSIGLLGLTSMIVGGVLEIQRNVRLHSVGELFENTVSLARILGPRVPQPMPNQFVWVYRPQASPDLPNVAAIRAVRVPYVPANLGLDSRLDLTLDIQGPYQRLNTYTNPNTGQTDPRPFYTGLRATPPDPVRYSCAVIVRPVPSISTLAGNNPDQSLVDVSVVVFEDYYEDPGDPNAPRPYTLNNVGLVLGNPALLVAPGTTVPSRAVILDGENGYAYRLVAGEVIPVPRANTNVIVVLPRAVEVLEAGIISRR